MINKFLSNAIDVQPVALIMDPVQDIVCLSPCTSAYYQAVLKVCD